MHIPNIAVIGAGLAGLACAQRLRAHRLPVSVFDKGRAPGGRMSTRRIQLGDTGVAFDHGAQYFTARLPGFRNLLDSAEAGTAVRPWTARLVELQEGGATLAAPELRHVGSPGMSALPRALAAGLDVRSGIEIIKIDGAPGEWRFETRDGPEEGPFSHVVVAVPAEQASRILNGHAPHMAREAAMARTAPCWTALLAFNRRIETGFDAARVNRNSPIGFISRQGRPEHAGNEAGEVTGAIDAWVVQATSEWSKLALERSADETLVDLLAAFRAIAPSATDPIYAAAHRWRFARVEQAAGSDFAWDEELGIGVCGDWRLGPRVELAWRSGDALGQHLGARIVPAGFQGQARTA